MLKNLKINKKILAYVLGACLAFESGVAYADLRDRNNQEKEITTVENNNRKIDPDLRAKQYSDELKNRESISIDDTEYLRFYSKIDNGEKKYYLVEFEILNDYNYYFDAITGEELCHYVYGSYEDRYNKDIKSEGSFWDFVRDNNLEKDFYSKADLEEVYNVFVENEKKLEEERINEAEKNMEIGTSAVSESLQNKEEYSFDDYKSAGIAKTSDGEYHIIVACQLTYYTLNQKCYFDLITGELLLKRDYDTNEIVFGDEYEMMDPFIDYFDIDADNAPVLTKDNLKEYLNTYIDAPSLQR